MFVVIITIWIIKVYPKGISKYYHEVKQNEYVSGPNLVSYFWAILIFKWIFCLFSGLLSFLYTELRAM